MRLINFSFKLAFVFRTEKPDGTLWVWANYKNYTRYFLLYMEDGFLTLDIQGQHNKKQLQYKEKRLDDGEWHAVDLRKENKELVLQVDNLQPESINDAPNPNVMRKRMYVGGVISKHKKIFTFNHGNFVGCMKDFIVDGIEQDLHAQTRDVILCKTTKDIAYVHKGGFMTFDALRSVGGPATDILDVDISIKFRATNSTGVLVALLSSPNNEEKPSSGLVVQLIEGNLVFTATHLANSVQIEHKVPIPNICPSEWHKFHITLTRTNVIINLDETRASFPISKLKKSTIDFFRSLPIHVGGVSANLAVARNLETLNGCFQEIHFGGTITPIVMAKRLHKVIPDGCPLL